MLFYLTPPGVFSDIHMLSLMYAGDMCYWVWSLLNPALTASATPTTKSLPLQQSKKKNNKSKSKVHPDPNSPSLVTKPISSSSDHAPSATPTAQQPEEKTGGDPSIMDTDHITLPVPTQAPLAPLATPTSCPAEQVAGGNSEPGADSNEDMQVICETVSSLATELTTSDSLRDMSSKMQQVCESVAYVLASDISSSDASPSSGNAGSKSELDSSMFAANSAPSESSSAVPGTSCSDTPGTSSDIVGRSSDSKDDSLSSSAMPCSSYSRDAASESSPVPGTLSDRKYGGSSASVNPSSLATASGTPTSRDMDDNRDVVSSISVAISASPLLSSSKDASDASGKDIGELVSSISVATSGVSGMCTSQEQASSPASEPSLLSVKLPLPRTSSPKQVDTEPVLGCKDPQTKTTPIVVTTPLEKTVSMMESMNLGPSSIPVIVSKERGGASQPHPPRYDLYHVIHHTCGRGAESRWKAEFNPMKQGTELLSKYIDTARGPLKGLGWDYSRAVGLMVKFKKGEAAAAAAAASK